MRLHCSWGKPTWGKPYLPNGLSYAHNPANAVSYGGRSLEIAPYGGEMGLHLHGFRAERTDREGERDMTQPFYYAHSPKDSLSGSWHLLKDHLAATAALAGRFAEDFDSTEWAKLAGLWHDVGKYLPDFQSKLQGVAKHVDHSIVGAILAESKGKGLRAALPVAFAIAGHHGGLPNLRSSESGGTPLLERLRDRKASLTLASEAIPVAIKESVFPVLPRFLQPTPGASGFDQCRAMEFWIRFLFSALVDADFLDTEEFYKPGLRRSATDGYSDIQTLRRRLDAHVDAISAPFSPVNRLRAAVLGACRDAAKHPPGIFSLTVPTGGGKTLSAMAFALRHAEAHGLKRVIVVIPYTSIIEQNARTYRNALGENVIEHHSNIDPNTETDRSRLASENWDAPIVVTTSVQFFESLFSNKPSRCRKLHNMARSVIILDEVQSLPSGFLSPILESMRELTTHYGSTIVLSTATQPALAKREALPDGLVGVREIAADPADLFRQLSRVEIAWPDVDAPPIAWPDLADDLARHDQVLAVVHRRDDARELAGLLPAEGLFHLSALMCPRHRSDVLATVKARLKDGQACRLVSTQLIEAGVDVDFPVVYRAMGGLDSIVQAAGRCNREGKLDTGHVVVFRAPTLPPRGTPAFGLETMESMLRQYQGNVDLADQAMFEEYFRVLYSKLEKDIRCIQRERQELNFATTAEKFRIIEDGYSEAIVVPYKESAERVDAARKEFNRATARGLQPFMVNVYPETLRLMEETGALELIGDSVRAILPPFHKHYDPTFGLIWKDKPGAGVV
jgi:CRISPR-associated endonuclease/helicase Cas3